MKAGLVQKGFKRAESKMKAIERAADIAAVRAINRTLPTFRKLAVKEVRSEITSKPTVIKEQLSTTRATRTNLTGFLVADAKPLNLIHFRARQTKKGVSVQVKKDKARKVVRGAFIAGLGLKKRVYRRLYKGPKKKLKPKLKYGMLPLKYRIPMKSLVSSSIAEIMQNKNVYESVSEETMNRLSKRYQHELKYYLSRN